MRGHLTRKAFIRQYEEENEKERRKLERSFSQSPSWRSPSPREPSSRRSSARSSNRSPIREYERSPPARRRSIRRTPSPPRSPPVRKSPLVRHSPPRDSPPRRRSKSPLFERNPRPRPNRRNEFYDDESGSDDNRKIEDSKKVFLFELCTRKTLK